jgi:Tfp pilus assembly protein PilX
MLIAVGVFAVTMALIVAGFTAANSDVHLTQNDLDQKKAYAAAQAGLERYVFELQQNVNYWNSCPSQTTPAAVPGSTNAVTGQPDEEYTFEPIAASSASSSYNGQCQTSDPVGSMIETASGPNPGAAGTFRVEFNGYAVDKQYGGNGGLVERSLVATFRRTGFLNYIYYTEFETDPSEVYPPATDCAESYSQRSGTTDCPQLDFITGDSINGPMHSEDTIQVCGSPTFGRAGHTPADAAEAPGEIDSSNCRPDSPTYNTDTGKLDEDAATVKVPPDNSQLKQIATTQFSGPTTIVLNGALMTVTNANISGGTETIPIPAGQVIYVSSTSCGVTYTPYISPDTPSAGCGDVMLSGNYTQSVTIAADNDIIIDGNITTDTSKSALLGLIANDYVRLYHPLDQARAAGYRECFSSDGCYACPHGANSCTCPAGASGCSCPTGYTDNNDPMPANVTIDAAILAVQKSFEVDNYDCGSPQGTITINGALAQLFRGTVGQHSGSTLTHGYTKNYWYDDRLLAEEPPYFLNPVNASWEVSRETECDAQSIAAACSN